MKRISKREYEQLQQKEKEKGKRLTRRSKNGYWKIGRN
nr:MAG TPA: hypothetical protein [Caudoviricetes sp.]